MAVNYEDERFQQVETDKNNALSEVEKTYSGLIEQSDAYYQNQIDATKEWEQKQSQLQQEQTDFAIDQIEQQKEQEQKDYTKEQSGAYVDWQKQSNEYGAKSEEIAAGGMTNTGFAESSQVSMYNTYQNRVATARESFDLAVQNYNNAITEARLQNNAALAEIAYQALQQQLELSLQGFQYKNQLILEKTNKLTEVEQQYYERYQDVLAQINQENALAEQMRQYNASLAEEQRQFDASLALQQQQQQQAQIVATPTSTGSGSNLQSWEKSTTSVNSSSNSSYSTYILRGNTTNAQKLVKSLKTMQGQTGSQTAIANSIVTYLSLGKINSNEAAYMLDYFGYNVGKYLK